MGEYLKHSDSTARTVTHIHRITQTSHHFHRVRTNMQNWSYDTLAGESILVYNGCMKKKEPQSTTEEMPEQASRERFASFSIRLPRELLGEMQRVASQHERSMNGEIVWALRAYVNNTRRKAATPVNLQEPRRTPACLMRG